MKVYVHGSMLVEDYGERLVPAEVTAVHEHSVDLQLEDGARYLDWRAKLYDEHENEVPLERIRRDFVASDLAALKARVEALEILATKV